MMVATCLHCGQDCRLTDGAEIYPHRPDLAAKTIHKCDDCNATVGCHPGTSDPLGFAADKITRIARMRLHERYLDPIWKRLQRGRKAARGEVYRFLAIELGIEQDNCHTGMFDEERCIAAQKALRDQTIHSIRDALRQHTLKQREAA